MASSLEKHRSLPENHGKGKLMATLVDPASLAIRQAISSFVPWYHGSINRNTSEAILLGNGQEGSYLLRDSENIKGAYVLSTRCSDSVKHYEIKVVDGGLQFGVALFESVDEFLLHFQNLPVIATESGISLTLQYPYPRFVSEPGHYVDISRHAETGPTDSKSDSDCHIASKEGFLTKLGAIHKNWKRRWFVLFKSELRYYKRRGVPAPIRKLNLKFAVEVTEDSSMGKQFCFRLVFPERTFYMLACNVEEMKEWIEIINWKLDYYKTHSTSGIR